MHEMKLIGSTNLGTIQPVENLDAYSTWYPKCIKQMCG